MGDHPREAGGPQAELIAQAAKLGAEAFRAGVKRVPATHQALMDLLKIHGAGQPVGWSIPMLDAWLNAWDSANLDWAYAADTASSVSPERPARPNLRRRRHRNGGGGGGEK